MSNRVFRKFLNWQRRDRVIFLTKTKEAWVACLNHSLHFGAPWEVEACERHIVEIELELSEITDHANG